ncbi:MAG: hypothetical protein Q9M89_10780 [Persephonella sp.]|nr:hypothetical protein [Persephonella sp.]
MLFRTNLFIPVFFFSIFVLGLSIGKYERLENKFYRNCFVGCITTSVPYVSNRFTAFRCYVIQTDRRDILYKTVNVFLRGENREVFLGSSVHFLGRVSISDNIIKAYPYQYFIQIDNSKNPFYSVYWLKNKLIERYKKLSDGDETFRMGLALIFGEKGYLGKEKEDFINAGTSHLLAISGMPCGDDYTDTAVYRSNLTEEFHTTTSSNILVCLSSVYRTARACCQGFFFRYSLSHI